MVFDLATVTDHATFAEPHQYATGVNDVWVNGMWALQNDEHTGGHARRVLRDPGIGNKLVG